MCYFSTRDTFLRKLSYYFYYFLWRHYSTKYSIHIRPETHICYGCYLGYGENITITEGAKIGNNVNINHGAAIGATNRGKKKDRRLSGIVYGSELMQLLSEILLLAIMFNCTVISR